MLKLYLKKELKYFNSTSIQKIILVDKSIFL